MNNEEKTSMIQIDKKKKKENMILQTWIIECLIAGQVLNFSQETWKAREWN